MTKSVNNVRVSLSRLALAKALKTPDENEQQQDSWEYSIIFYQSHISHEMLQQLVDGGRSVRREQNIRHFDSKITPQQHWQHSENIKSSSMIHPSITSTEIVTTTGTNSIGSTNNYISGHDNNNYLKSTTSSSTSEESVPTTPTTPKPVPIVLQQQQQQQQQHDVHHHSSGVSHQEVYNNSSVVNGYTNINKKACNDYYKEKQYYESRRNDGISIDQKDNKRDIQISRYIPTRPASPVPLQQQMQFMSLDENQGELLHKLDHKSLVAPRYQQVNNKHYYPHQQQGYHHYYDYNQQIKAPSKPELTTPPQKYYYQLSQLQKDLQYPSQMDNMTVSSARSYGSLPSNNYHHIRKSSSYNSLGSVATHNTRRRRQHGRSPLSAVNTEENKSDETYVYNQARSDARRRAEIMAIESTTKPCTAYNNISTFNNNYNTMPYSMSPPTIFMSSTPTLSPSYSSSNLSYYNCYGNTVATPTTPGMHPMMVYPNPYSHQYSM
ncbi:hypothetical protein INT45_013918 [Circinella minor]|uniref:Uncharacterized protein n=1 Tax=Circinella minor TaxID=1195481 RepID=A0A8H7RXU5_9FUNG|nr:hypothetical protein INT45_013918 [Circinella minor]